MQEREKLAQFEKVVTPQLGASYNLARWLTHNDQDAEDVVQESCMRAFRSIDSFHGGDGRAWMLAIVRNTSYTWLHRSGKHSGTVPFDDSLQDVAGSSPSPEVALMRHVDRQALASALADLPVEFREVIVLRELEDLSYREIARIADLPMGTVMSRIARARRRLQQTLSEAAIKEKQFEL